MIKANAVKQSYNRRQRKDNIEGFLFAFPPMLRFLLFNLVPLAVGLIVAFMNTNRSYDFTQGTFCGLDNFKTILTDAVFWQSIGNTLYLGLSWVISMALAMVVSVFLAGQIKGKAFFRLVYYLPFVCSTVAITLIWQVLLDYNYGAVNTIIDFLGGARIDFKGDPDWYLPGLVIMTAWSTMGYKIVILTAALTNVNRSYYEAASLDGANAWQKFVHVTMPAISPTVFYLAVTGLINVLQEFTRSQVWAPDGGPNGKGITIVFYLYREGFDYTNMGTASAVAWVLSIMIVLVTIANFALSKKWVKYD